MKNLPFFGEADCDSLVLIPSCGNFCGGTGVSGAYPEKKDWGGIRGVERAQTSRYSPEAWHIQGRI